MRGGAKENWFQSPHTKNGVWFFHEEKNELFNFSKSGVNDRGFMLTPSRTSRPVQMQRVQKTPGNYIYEPVHPENKFDDINLPDMFCNTMIQRPVINEKLNFEDSSMGSQDGEYRTPNHMPCEQYFYKQSKEQPRTAAKEKHLYSDQKKPRPKEKGLRMLSQKAYEIVMKMNGATYKEVANELVEDLAAEESLEINGKDQQNIKRRVYDALNVLIALGILKKEGRKIHGVRKNQDEGTNLKAEFKRYQQLLAAKQFKLNEKKEQVKTIKIRAETIKALMKRNAQLTRKTHRLEFPFIALTIPSEDQRNIVLKPQRIEIYSDKKIVGPFGDLDTMEYLRGTLKHYIQ